MNDSMMVNTSLLAGSCACLWSISHFISYGLPPAGEVPSVTFTSMPGQDTTLRRNCSPSPVASFQLADQPPSLVAFSTLYRWGKTKFSPPQP